MLKITLKMSDQVKAEEGGSQEWLIQTLLFGLVFIAPDQLADNNQNNKRGGCTLNDVPAWANDLIRYFSIFHDQDPSSNLYFQNPEKISGGEDVCVRPTRGSGLSRYWVMVNYPGVCLLLKRTLNLSTMSLNY